MLNAMPSKEFKPVLIWGIGAGSGALIGLLAGGAILCAAGIYGGLILGLTIGWWVRARMKQQGSPGAQF